MIEKQFPDRQSIRLKSFDYSLNGVFFVTICTHDRQLLFDEIIWCHRANDFVERHVGATLCGRPPQTSIMIENWLHEIGTKFSGILLDSYAIMPDHIHAIFIVCRDLYIAGDHAGSPLQKQIKCDEKLDNNTQMNRLGDVVGWFKTMTTNEYIKGVRQGIYPRFDTKLWQRNYYEHIVRNEADLSQVRRYVYENPIRWEIDGKEPSQGMDFFEKEKRC